MYDFTYFTWLSCYCNSLRHCKQVPCWLAVPKTSACDSLPKAAAFFFSPSGTPALLPENPLLFAVVDPPVQVESNIFQESSLIITYNNNNILRLYTYKLDVTIVIIL